MWQKAAMILFSPINMAGMVESARCKGQGLVLGDGVVRRRARGRKGGL